MVERQRCYLSDGRDLSAEMVKLGLALDWPKFSGGKYRELETSDARTKLFLADARQKGRMHVWETSQGAESTNTAVCLPSVLMGWLGIGHPGVFPKTWPSVADSRRDKLMQLPLLFG